ncbi:MAG: alkene reductase [Alphaproteobacteria bacterium HGW-Alphaproteobacteria-5]|jgi:2,4-dienoyl-CoA reductase-like NADH-dependent reductase (Old Yellow Enzyme family)|nr:MAG: alkene reductase [Alphaproteobacteria bacterium HGW-Alphaproteobacteria-5]
MPTLFDPVRIGDLDLPNRIIMAPLTRTRAIGGAHIPNELMAEYYVQRASAGLIFTEATVISPMGVGYANVPGVWTAEHIEGWRRITDAVHRAGGRIFQQLWHVGRISHPTLLGGALPVAPSAIAAEGTVKLLRPKQPYPVPRALEEHELPGIVEEYRNAARNAQAAGFDGVEVHGANGYLLDQFLQDATNRRDDGFGGSVENRAKLLLDVTDAVIGVWGASRVGVHISPRCDRPGLGDSDPRALFGHVVEELARRRIAFIFSREYEDADSLGPDLRSRFSGAWIANELFTRDSAQAAVETGRADAVAFGRLFIANPDLPARFRIGAPLNEVNADTVYFGHAAGYTDYAPLDIDHALPAA